MVSNWLKTLFSSLYIILRINYKTIFTEKYPEIKNLFVHDPNFKWIVSGMVAVQLAMLFFVANLPWYLVIGLAYGFGGIINHSLMLGKYNYTAP